MTFWQENYGFVREVYDFRCSKYQEWMDNIEAIIEKVMANTQYTAREFKLIKDTFTVCKHTAYLDAYKMHMTRSKNRVRFAFHRVTKNLKPQ